ncbi:MAG: M10 family metallopeptidase [Pseudomonadota bacterium]
MTSPTASMQVTEVSGSGTTSIDALLGGTKWGGAQGGGANISYSFPYTTSVSATWVSNYSDDNEPSYARNYSFTTTHQTAARLALQQWANVADLTFSQTSENSSNVGDIRFAFTAAPAISSSWGWAYYPSAGAAQGGDIWVNPDNIIESWAVDGYNFSSLLHETGHALGLKHSFEVAPTLPPSNESTQYTVMSYTEHPHSFYREVTDQGGGYYTWEYYDVQPRTPMLYDIAAMQYLYGANTAYNTGNDTYAFDADVPFFMTIWDTGGTDTLSVSNFSRSCTIDLRAGYFSKITIESDPLPAGASSGRTPTYDGTDNLAIAYGVTIENATGGSGNDSLTGNDAGNTLTGGQGNDTLTGGAGIDTAVYSSNRAICTLTTTGTGYGISGGSEGTDTLTGIERLQFVDSRLALDLDGAAGNTAKLIAAAFGRQYLLTPALVGAGLGVFDAGMTMQQVAELALNTELFLQLAGSRNNEAVVTQLYRSVLDVTPPSEQLDYFAGLLTAGMSQADLLVLAAENDINIQHIDLVGLIQSGIEFA